VLPQEVHMTDQPGRPGDQRTMAGRPGETQQAYRDGDDGRQTWRQPAHSETRHMEREVITTAPRGSRLRGGPVLGGFVIGFATWILLELALFALDLGALAAQVVPNNDASTWWWSGVAAVIAFLLGGLVAGASLPYRRVDDGILNGIAVWAVTVVALIVMSAVGAGIGFGVVGDLLASSPNLADADASAINDAQSAAGAAVLALAVTLAAAAIGGAIGSKLWPGDDDGRKIDVRR
jgi:hypothetical protein